ncbi:MAG TPA: ABC transporter permease [Gammaproteobacteria bacterium]
MWRDQVARDVRSALRIFGRTPGPTAVIVLTIALGIGATTAIFSVVNAVLLQPLPYPDSDRLVRIVENVPSPGNGVPAIRTTSMRHEDFEVWRASATMLSHVAASSAVSRTLRTSDGAVRLNGAQVSSALFPMLGLEPVLGRGLLPDEERPDAGVVVLNESTWRRHFDADPGIVDSTLLLDGSAYVVVGVMPAAFGPEDFWIPYVAAPPRPGVVEAVSVRARLRDGVSIENASAQANGIGSRLRGTQIVRGGPPRFEIVRELDEATAHAAPALRMLMLAVGAVLLLVCTNVANLLLARGTRRYEEVAVRRALGATRGRIVRQVMTESLILALLGGAVGLALAYVGVAAARTTAAADLPQRFVQGLGPAVLPRLDEISMDLAAFGFAAMLSVAAAIVFGLWPALRLARAGELRSHTPAAVRNARAGHALGTVQLALAMTLLVAAGLLLHSFVGVARVETGFDPRRTLSFEVVMPGEYAAERRIAAAEQLIARLRAHPQVTSVGFTSAPPLQPGLNLPGGVPVLPPGASIGMDFAPQGTSAEARNEEEDRDRGALRTQTRFVSSGYLQALGARLVEGRWFTGDETAAAGMTVLVSRPFAQRYFPAGDAIGSTISMERPFGTLTIVGVVDDMRLRGLDRPPDRAIFIEPQQLVRAVQAARRAQLTFRDPYVFFTMRGFSTAFALRSSGDPLALADEVRAAAREVDAGIAVEYVMLAEDIISGITARPRFYALVLGAFGAIAGLIALIGIYGVLSYFVAQRTKEIGIRMALGAQPGAVRRLVLRQGAAMTAIGVCVGLAGAAALSRSLDGMLVGLTTLDATTYVAVAAAFAAVAMLAVYLPARRATTVDPLVALRHD